MSRIGTTMDDAIGEAFDKTAKLLGLGYPGGPQVEQEALRGNPVRFLLPRPMHGRPEADFSLSGLKTALRLEAEKIAPLTDQDVADLCASFQQAVVETVMDRLRAGLRDFPRALWRADRAGRSRRRRRQSGDPQGSASHRIRSRHRAGRAAARALHRQRRDDRLGRRGAAGARPHRFARHRAARALAARRSEQAGAAGELLGRTLPTADAKATP